MASAESAIRIANWKRLDGIDSLRGLAIFFVLVHHVGIRLAIAHVPYAKGLPAQLADSLFKNGQNGVQIFFVISGFLITSITLRRWGSLSHVSVRDFYLLRFARIAPLLFLLLAVLSGLHFAHVKDFVVTQRTGGLGRALLAALTFHINVLEARTWYLPGNWDILWSLSVEEMFYLFFPLVCRLIGRGKLFVVLLLTFVVLGPFGRTVLAYGNETWQDYSYLGGMDAIALGCFTALLVSRVRFSRRVLWITGSAGAAMLILVLFFSVPLYAWGHDRYGLTKTILALGTCLIVAVAAQTQWKSPRILSPLLGLGQRSYEVYLTHMFVVYAFFDVFLHFGKPMRLVPVLFVVTIVIAAALGAAVASLYSEPMNRRLRNYSSRGRADRASVIDSESLLPSES